jgi:hypothetical protein
VLANLLLLYPQGKGAGGTGGAASADSSSTSSKSSPTSGSGPVLAPAVDMQQLAGQPNSYVVCVPGLHSADEATRKMAQRLAATLGSKSHPKLRDAAVTQCCMCDQCHRVLALAL